MGNDTELLQLHGWSLKEEVTLKKLKNHFFEEIERVQLEETLLRAQIAEIEGG